VEGLPRRSRVLSPGLLADAKVVGADLGLASHRRVGRGEHPPGAVDRQDRAVGGQHADMGRQGIEDVLVEPRAGLQNLGGLAGRGDVADHHAGAQRSVGVGVDRGGDLAQEGRPVPSTETKLPAEGAGAIPLCQLGLQARIAGIDHGRPAQSQQLLAGTAEEPAGGAVGVEDPAIRRGEEHRVQAGREQSLVRRTRLTTLLHLFSPEPCARPMGTKRSQPASVKKNRQWPPKYRIHLISDGHGLFDSYNR
jgi:hypothetical protein